MLYTGDDNPNHLDEDDFILGHFKDTISYIGHSSNYKDPYIS